MKYQAVLLLIICLSCQKKSVEHAQLKDDTGPHLIVLGNVQDAGSPHAGCQKSCCSALFDTPDPDRMVTSLGLVDPKSGKYWMFEASPDLPRQMKVLERKSGGKKVPDGIFLTHAHIGHYAGLMYLGKESMNASGVNVYAMPRMKEYLSTNGPWSQLVEIGNIELIEQSGDSTIYLSDAISVTPFLVPHRDEFSETVGYRINGPNTSVLFIPDIDKWSRWERDIREEIKKVDYAFLDATFFDQNEVARDISEIPHPFVIESMELFKGFSSKERAKVQFIHFNHTNPLLDKSSPESTQVEVLEGFGIARYGEVYGL